MYFKKKKKKNTTKNKQIVSVQYLIACLLITDSVAQYLYLKWSYLVTTLQRNNMYIPAEIINFYQLSHEAQK